MEHLRQVQRSRRGWKNEVLHMRPASPPSRDTVRTLPEQTTLEHTLGPRQHQAPVHRLQHFRPRKPVAIRSQPRRPQPRTGQNRLRQSPHQTAPHRGRYTRQSQAAQSPKPSDGGGARAKARSATRGQSAPKYTSGWSATYQGGHASSSWEEEPARRPSMTFSPTPSPSSTMRDTCACSGASACTSSTPR